jgi:deoxyribonuclease-1-like protein
VQKLLGVVGLLLTLGAIGWFALNAFDIQGLEHIQVVRKPAGPATANDAFADAASGRFDATASGMPDGGRSTIRVASFNIQVFGESKLNKPEVVRVLAEVARQFDVLAIQEVRATSQDVLPRFVEQINATGRKYDFVIGPRLGRTNSKEQYAFVYDTATIEVDRQSMYTVSDPDDLLHREPLVAGFRARGPPTNQAFTFTLINIHTDPDEADTELDALGEVYLAVRQDGRGEDDIVLLGDLNVDDQHLGRLGRIPDITPAIYGVPSNTRGTKLYDNIVFDGRATAEFTGRAGVYDLIREYQLTLPQALEVSDHLPVWAEFSVLEGGQAGRVASQPERGPLR